MTKTIFALTTAVAFTLTVASTSAALARGPGGGHGHGFAGPQGGGGGEWRRPPGFDKGQKTGWHCKGARINCYPPGWSKGRKTGWGSGEPHVPPGLRILRAYGF
jgi:hypothetical protein